MGIGDFTPRDYDTLTQAQIDYIKADPVLSLIWTDFQQGNIGMALIGVNSFLGEQLEHALDFRSAELYRTTARLKESIWRIAKSVGYPIPGATAAVATLTLTLQSGAPGTLLTLPALVLSAGGVSWYYAGGATIAAAASSVSIAWSQGTLRSLSFSGDGTAYQRYSLGVVKLADATVQVRVAGVLWEKVEQIGLATYEQTAYELFRDEDNILWVQFGNLFAGKRPGDGITIDVTYLETQGSDGNVGNSAFTGKTVAWFASELGISVTADVVLVGEVIGGTNEPATETVKSNLVPWQRTIGVGITATDIAALAVAYTHPTLGSVAKCTAQLHYANEQANIVKLWIASAADEYSLADPPAALQAALLTYMNTVKIISIEYLIDTPDYQTIDLTVNVHKAEGADDTEVTALITAALQTMFNVANTEIGQDKYLSDMYAALEALAGVDWVLFPSRPGNIEADADLGEVLQLGTVTVVFV